MYATLLNTFYTYLKDGDATNDRYTTNCRREL
jgi:hypothetical protein